MGTCSNSERQRSPRKQETVPFAFLTAGLVASGVPENTFGLRCELVKRGRDFFGHIRLAEEMSPGRQLTLAGYVS